VGKLHLMTTKSGHHTVSTSSPYVRAATHVTVAANAIARNASGLMRSSRRTNLSMTHLQLRPCTSVACNYCAAPTAPTLMANTFWMLGLISVHGMF